eukprot:123213-Alexandrium_andersonii.AAC.1
MQLGSLETRPTSLLIPRESPGGHPLWVARPRQNAAGLVVHLLGAPEFRRDGLRAAEGPGVQ